MKISRIAGVTLPLFSIRTQRDWGIGEIPDLPACAAWLRRAGQRLVQLLPPHELSEGETSPYGARTAFGLDPIYIGVHAVTDLDPASLSNALGAEGEAELARLRALPGVDYSGVRKLKFRVLRVAFDRFKAQEWNRKTPRAQALAAFIEKEKGWLDDLALYTALRESHNGYGWETWPEDERERIPQALQQVRKASADRILEVAYLQWILIEQWEQARAELAKLQVAIMGDLPFVVCPESADVWSRPGQFHRALSLGAPPDWFAPDGQDWGLPPYNWLAMECDNFAWVRARTAFACRLYDCFRLDHVIGYFRQWVRSRLEWRGRFDPEDLEAQRALGLRVLGTMVCEAAKFPIGPTDSRIIAEDLGVIPPFARISLTELEVPGYRVIPWEQDEDKVFRDPSKFPTLSVACYSTHDTAPITAWWDDFTDDERAQLSKMADIKEDASERERTLALLRLLYESTSDTTLVLAQELLGERCRINLPGTVGENNWTYRLPSTIEVLASDDVVASRFEEVRVLVEANGR
ncbi:MAG: 4-alpha-glucanotransferase [Myxococcales bacterium]